MSRKSTIDSFLGKQIGGIVILRKHGSPIKRQKVMCKCIPCGEEFSATFHNVYRGNYKSCGCLQYALNTKNPRWQGYGEISKSFFYSIKNGAKKRNINFNLTIEDIWQLFLDQNRKCRLSGQNIFFQKFRLDNNASASLDRIDSLKGYYKENVQWVHKSINYMKQSMDNKEFLDNIKKIYEHNFK